MRRISGVVVMPTDAPLANGRLTVELRDVTYLDAPAPLIASSETDDIATSPTATHDFAMYAPDLPRRALALRCHIALSAGMGVQPGDLLSTRSVPVPATGDADGLTVPVARI